MTATNGQSERAADKHNQHVLFFIPDAYLYIVSTISDLWYY